MLETTSNAHKAVPTLNPSQRIRQQPSSLQNFFFTSFSLLPCRLQTFPCSRDAIVTVEVDFR